ncbi:MULTISPECIES: FAD-binding oxidoreductase [unclassified Bosea (in: a-proteobacteria)]|uniref:NAD(P)/FAD-dependent oxidoreductase n=1 Tax=unclassified Bosea (in: a-proteobacteria) TaxID=2653178 RepID=UPI000F74C656|nr:MULTISPECIES: FAD-binding oxidoreductase [unclassified Bosea (in: a-proteobacteria)]AZO80588.1 FAD-dependent oxidoreductase [Bosea sp. Tri-49]RXT23393.1 FAD-dependent oxidoreductase [Bosea sp. Tri-39]RXT38866.1 FAD-dependent oxidoreductase [Bosea sp. Tri-54]
MSERSTEVAVVGAGIVGIACAYYLVKQHGIANVVLIDPRDPMSLTSAQSGENYRNWWPHPVMTAYTDHSIDLMEAIARESSERINMTRRGYALVTRRSLPEDLIEDLHRGYSASPDRPIRVHEAGSAGSYSPPVSAHWQKAPQGVDVLCDPDLIQATFPSWAKDIRTVLHIRRAGSISGQQLGQYMLEAIRTAGGKLIRGEVSAIEGTAPFALRVSTADGSFALRADRLVNAAGPFFADVAAMLGETLPVTCVFQQKISFEDREQAIPRDMPFTIDLDGQEIAWSEEEREILSEDAEAAKLLRPMPGGVHCRPDGAEDGKWIKLGWAYNERPADPHEEDPTDSQFPDSVIRAASRLHPKLEAYIGRLPRGAHHYGGYYAMTAENWPLIGPMKTPGAFMAGALSGFGTMAACSTGSVCAAWVAGGELPAYARPLSLARYDDTALMAELAALSSRGVL